jgi:teichuronic acid exporter
VYQLAAKVFESIRAAILTPAAKVFFIVFARTQNDGTGLNRSFIAALSLVALAAFPAFFGLSAIAERAVPILFGEQWAITSRFLEVIALAGLPMTFSIMSGALLAGLGRASTFLRVELATAFLGALLIVAVSYLGIAWIPFAILAREVLAAVFHAKVILPNVDVQQVWHGLTGAAFMVALVMYVGLRLLNPLFPPGSVPALLASIAIGSALYAACLTVFFRGRVLSEVENLRNVHESVSSTRL